MSIDVKITNDNTQKVLDSMERATARALERIGLRAERIAKGLCHVDTGRLRNSITHATAQYSGQGTYVDNMFADATAKAIPFENSVYIGTNVQYGPYVEVGREGKGAYPFLKPAMEGHISDFKKIIDDEFKNPV